MHATEQQLEATLELVTRMCTDKRYGHWYK